MKKYLDDAFILIGCGFIIWATWRISFTAAIYVAGVILIVLGLLIGISGKKVNR